MSKPKKKAREPATPAIPKKPPFWVTVWQEREAAVRTIAGEIICGSCLLAGLLVFHVILVLMSLAHYPAPFVHVLETLDFIFAVSVLSVLGFGFVREIFVITVGRH